MLQKQGASSPRANRPSIPGMVQHPDPKLGLLSSWKEHCWCLNSQAWLGSSQLLPRLCAGFLQGWAAVTFCTRHSQLLGTQPAPSYSSWAWTGIATGAQHTLPDCPGRAKALKASIINLSLMATQGVSATETFQATCCPLHTTPSPSIPTFRDRRKINCYKLFQILHPSSSDGFQLLCLHQLMD